MALKRKLTDLGVRKSGHLFFFGRNVFGQLSVSVEK
jgi:hypothetical protein